MHGAVMYFTLTLRRQAQSAFGSEASGIGPELGTKLGTRLGTKLGI